MNISSVKPNHTLYGFNSVNLKSKLAGNVGGGVEKDRSMRLYFDLN
jgi:hypothetical protein